MQRVGRVYVGSKVRWIEEVKERLVNTGENIALTYLAVERSGDITINLNKIWKGIPACFLWRSAFERCEELVATALHSIRKNLLDCHDQLTVMVHKRRAG